jgi:beta-glucanase (GH16 family)
MKTVVAMILCAASLSLTGCAAINMTSSATADVSSKPSTQTAVPLQASSAGFKNLNFDDEFTSAQIAPSSTSTASYNWYPGIWFESPAPSTSQFSVSSGVLNLNWTRSSWSSNGLCDASLEGTSKNGTPNHSFRYGYVEVRAKWDTVTGAWPAMWLLPEEGIAGQTPTGEIDLFEGQGADPTFYGTLHTWNEAQQLWYSTPNSFATPAGTDYSQWHTYGLLWTPPSGTTPGKITWYLDNVALGSSNTTSSAQSVFDTQHYYLILGMQEGVNWGTCKPLTDGSPASINMQVDWVHVFGS